MLVGVLVVLSLLVVMLVMVGSFCDLLDYWLMEMLLVDFYICFSLCVLFYLGFV